MVTIMPNPGSAFAPVWLLALETATDRGSAALLHEGRPVGCRGLEPGAYSMQLIPAMDALLAEAGVRRRELNAIAVAHGPGSFTGVRVGLTLAKGLGEVTGVPVLGVSTLAALAEAEPAGPTRHPALAILDAARNEVYCGYYPAGPVECEIRRRTGAEAAQTGVEFLTGMKLLADRLRELGCSEAVALQVWPAEFAPILQAHLPGRKILIPPKELAPRVGRLALAVWRQTAGALDAGDDRLALDANYIRRPDAEALTTHLPSR